MNGVKFQKEVEKFNRFFGRFRNESNAFTITTVIKSCFASNNEDYSETTMDNAYKYMSSTPDASLDEMNRFKQHIDFEECDTD